MTFLLLVYMHKLSYVLILSSSSVFILSFYWTIIFLFTYACVSISEETV